MSRTLAIIPARGGSKGVPGKNLRQLAGRPLIEWTIVQSLAASGITDTVVSTDDPQIAAVAKAAGAQVPFLRPAALATDVAPTEPAMLHALEEMEKLNGPYETVVLLQPTSPLRLPDTIDRALVYFAEQKADSLLGVVESHAFFWRGEPAEASYDVRNRPRRQDLRREDRRMRETGSLYITARDVFVTERNRLAGNIVLFEMKEQEGWEIDGLSDFAILEALMKQEGFA